MTTNTTPLYAPHVRHFKSPYPLMAIVLGLLLVFLASEAMMMTFATMENSLIERVQSGGTVSGAEADANDQRVALALLLNFASILALAIVFLFWVFRAASNMRDMRVSDEGVPRFTPGWAVGWWIVPFFSLWMPLQVMRELWHRCHPVDIDSRPNDGLLVVWWLVWLIANGLGWFSIWAGRDSVTLVEVQYDNNVLLISGGFRLVAGLLMGILVWQISRQQVIRRSGLTDVRE